MQTIKLDAGIMDAYIQDTSREIPARKVFLDLEAGELLDVCDDSDQMEVFERWAEMDHKYHMKSLDLLRKYPKRFLEVPLPNSEEAEFGEKVLMLTKITNTNGIRLKISGWAR